MMLAPYVSRLFCACTVSAGLSVSSVTTVPMPTQQPGDEERGARLAAAQVAEGDGVQLSCGQTAYGRVASGRIMEVLRARPEAVGGDRRAGRRRRCVSSGIGLQPPVTTLIWSLGNAWPQLLHTIASPSCW